MSGVKKFTTSSLKDEYGIQINQILDLLILKLGDSNQKLKQQCHDSVMLSTLQPLISYEAVIESILLNKVNNKNSLSRDQVKVVQTSQKVLGSKILILTNVVEEFQQHVIQGRINIVPIIEFALNNLSTNNAQVRLYAYLLLLTIYQIIGPKMQPLLERARPAQIELFNQACLFVNNGQFEKARELLKRQTLSQVNSGQPIQAKYFDSTGDYNDAFKRGVKISLEPAADGKYKIVDVCRYCGKQDEFFKEEAVMRNHIKNKCKMISKCPHCSDLIEASEMKEHWLKHCKAKSFKQC
mmetsp:Transcript_12812/g.21684  ORF Transcript_12812/g.21684 Transcript_12812/m.21684 type:complete len:296 (+) Transcript_12812:1555-2442(+)